MSTMTTSENADTQAAAGRAAWAGPSAGRPTVVIQAQPDSMVARLRSLWAYRSFYGLLFKELTMRKGRGTLLGKWWVFLRPALPAIGLIFAFSAVAPVDSGGLPYPVFFLSGYITWALFQSSLRWVPRSLGWAQGLMRRTYFPRLLVPMAGFGMTFIQFAVLTLVFVLSVIYSTFRPGGSFPLQVGWHTLWLLPCLVASLALALAFGQFFGIVALFFRDVIFSLRLFAQVFLLLTPVIYPITLIPEAYRPVVYVVNPMAQLVIVSRWSLTGQGEFQLGFLLLSFATVLAMLVASTIFFLRAEVFLGDQL